MPDASEIQNRTMNLHSQNIQRGKDNKTFPNRNAFFYSITQI